MRIDRLTGPDLSGFGPDRFGWPAQTGLIAVLDGRQLFDGSGQLRLGDVQDRIAGRLHSAPRLRQVVRRPAHGLGRPIWVDAHSFRITNHVRFHPLPAGADRTGLLEACEELRQRPLNQSHPRWELWLLPGLPGGQVGMFARLHHSIADGPAGLALLGDLLDHTPDTTAPYAAEWVPRPPPSTRDLLMDNVRRHAAGVTGAAQRLRHPMESVNRLRRAWPLFQEFAGERRPRRTSLNAPIGSTRRMAVVTCGLSAIKSAAHQLGATVNDALLAAVTGGLRELLESRGESVAGAVLQAIEPVSLQDPAVTPVQGNRYGVMVVPLPVGESDTIRRLQKIAAETAPRKLRPRPAWGTGVFGSLLMQRLTLPLAGHQHVINIHVTNVRGLAEPLYLAGARITTAFPVVPLTGSLTIGVGVLSYIDQLNVTVVADRDRCPDLEVFTEALNRSMSELIEATPPD